MAYQKPKESLQEFFSSIHNSYQQNQKRDATKDFEKILKIANIKWSANFAESSIPHIPTIVAVNHFVRPLLLRKSPFTTFDSMVTSAIVTLAHQKIAGRRLTWIVKDDLRENIFFLSAKIRKIQIAAIDCYDFIGISKNYPFGQFEKWQNYLKKGFDIAFYPEGRTSVTLKKPKSGFKKMLAYLIKNGLDFQIIPVSIYLDNGIYRAVIAKPILPITNASLAAKDTMAAITKNLPGNLRGYHKNNMAETVFNRQIQGPKQLVNGLISQLRELLRTVS